jgi:hypothetical protein
MMTLSGLTMVACPQCRTSLVMEGASLRDVLRCSRCGACFFASGAPAEGKLSRKAVASFILAVSAVALPLIAALPAVVLGILALREIRRSPGQVRGSGWAIGSIACAIVLTALQALIASFVGLVIANAARGGP